MILDTFIFVFWTLFLFVAYFFLANNGVFMKLIIDKLSPTTCYVELEPIDPELSELCNWEYVSKEEFEQMDFSVYFKNLEGY